MQKRHPIKLERTLLLLIKTKRIIITPTDCHYDIIMIGITNLFPKYVFTIEILVSLEFNKYQVEDVKHFEKKLLLKFWPHLSNFSSEYGIKKSKP